MISNKKRGWNNATPNYYDKRNLPKLSNLNATNQITYLKKNIIKKIDENLDLIDILENQKRPEKMKRGNNSLNPPLNIVKHPFKKYFEKMQIMHCESPRVAQNGLNSQIIPRRGNQVINFNR